MDTTRQRLLVFGTLCAFLVVALATWLWSDSGTRPQDLPSLELRVYHRNDDRLQVGGKVAGLRRNVLQVICLPPETNNKAKITTDWYDSIVGTRYRASASGSWQILSNSNSTVKTSDDITLTPLENGPFNHKVLINYPKPGYWITVVSTFVRCRNTENSEEWIGKATTELRTTVPPLDLAKRYGRSASTTRLEPFLHKKYIRALQWYDEATSKWRDVPASNGAQSPLKAFPDSVMKFRAMKIFPDEQWPDWPQPMPQWKTDACLRTNDTRDDRVFEVVFDPTSSTVDQVISVSAAAGNTVTAYVRVVSYDAPTQKSFPIKASRIELRNESYRDDVSVYDPATQLPLVGTLVTDDTDHFHAKLHFAPHYPDGTRAGEINGPGEKDDTCITSNRGECKVTLSPGNRPGKVQVTASVVEILGNKPPQPMTANIVVEFQPPRFRLQYEPWSFRGDEWLRTCRIQSLIGQFIYVPNVRFRLSLMQSAGTSAAQRRASWLETPVGTTGPIGEIAVVQHWRPLPGASRQLRNYNLIVEQVKTQPGEEQAREPAFR